MRIWLGSRGWLLRVRRVMRLRLRLRNKWRLRRRRLGMILLRLLMRILAIWPRLIVVVVLIMDRLGLIL